MADTETRPKTGEGPAAPPAAAPDPAAGRREQDGGPGGDLAGLEAGLDALDTRTASRTPLPVLLRRKALPPLVAVVLVLGLWQAAFALELKPDYQLPSPLMVWDALAEEWYKGTILGIVWQSVSRGALGFAVALLAGTPLGLLVARGSGRCGPPSDRSSPDCSRCPRWRGYRRRSSGSD